MSMTREEAFRKIINDISVKLGESPAESDLPLIRSIFDAGVEWQQKDGELVYVLSPGTPIEKV